MKLSNNFKISPNPRINFKTPLSIMALWRFHRANINFKGIYGKAVSILLSFAFWQVTLKKRWRKPHFAIFCRIHCSKGDSTIKGDFASLDSTDSTHGDFHSNFRGESHAFAESPLPVFTQTHTWLNAYFSGEIPRFMPKIALPRTASPFRLLVWEILRDIPYGETAFYGEIARKIEQKLSIAKMSVQAVGNAISKNPIAIIIPCHRVIGVKNIGGYSGGIAHKIALLKHENIL